MNTKEMNVRGLNMKTDECLRILVGVLKKADQKRWAALLDEVISEDYSHEFIKGFIYAMGNALSEVRKEHGSEYDDLNEWLDR